MLRVYNTERIVGAVPVLASSTYLRLGDIHERRVDPWAHRVGPVVTLSASKGMRFGRFTIRTVGEVFGFC